MEDLGKLSYEQQVERLGGVLKRIGDARDAKFLSLEEVWECLEVNLDCCQQFDFERTSTIKISCYVDTENDARDDDQYRSTTSQAASTVSELARCKVDIFGNPKTVAAEKAHLMSNAKGAKKWPIAVPWILPNVPVDFEDEDEYESLMDRYINGSRPHGDDDTPRKKGSGIRHFLSNRIIMVHKKCYYDQYPCIFIIPILTVDEAREWNGAAYDAVFLAASRNGSFNTDTVYSQVGAIPENKNLEAHLARPDEINTARDLLSCVVQSLSKLRIATDNFANSALVPFSVTGVFLPGPKNLNADAKVRKVSFDDAAQSNGGHPAPDPILLVFKGAENWGGMYNFPLLRAVGEQDGSDSESTSVMSLAAEARMRGWPEDFSHLCKDPPVMDVVFDGTDNHLDEVVDDENYDWDVR
jgi:hypothetical protein